MLPGGSGTVPQMPGGGGGQGGGPRPEMPEGELPEMPEGMTPPEGMNPSQNGSPPEGAGGALPEADDEGAT